MKRSREVIIKSELQFFVFNPIDKHSATFEVSRYGKEQNFYVLKFHRPGLKQPHLYSFYALNGNNECIYSIKLAQGNPQETTALMDRTYQVYETYALGQDTETTHSMYFQIVQDSKNKHNEECSKYRMCVDMTLSWLPKHITHFERGVKFFPYDVDPTKYGLKLNTTQIIQKTPIWFKVRGEVSGTKAYQLLGFWVPTEKEDPAWTLDGDHVFSEQSKANMRFGSESEDKGLLTYALNSKNISKIQLAGWCNAPPSAGLPTGWGASPDGLVCEPSHTWSEIPESIRKFYEDSLSVSPLASGSERNKFDPTLGVLEIKSSPTKLSFEPYFFPQVYMEMIATHRIWCDLVRYTPTKIRVYRIYRHKPTEDTLISLWKNARKRVDNLRKTIQEEPYVKMRNYFKELAKSLTFTEIPTNRTEIKAYEEYQKERETQGFASSLDVSFLLKKHKSTWFEEADNNHKAFYGAVNDPIQLKQLILKQMDIYTQVLKDL